MLVSDIMTKAVLTVAPETTLQAACRIMNERNVRHLPVLDDERVVGVITDHDLGGAISILCGEPVAPQGLVRDVMAHPPKTAHPLDSVGESARTMRRLKIGCLPVVDDDRLVGIVTGINLLDALLRLTGIDKPTGRIDLRLPDRPGELARLTALVSERGVNIHSILTYPESGESVRTGLRVDTLETSRLGQILREAGFEVLWPADKPWRS